MNSNNDPIATALGITPIPKFIAPNTAVIEAVTKVEVVPVDSEIQEDYIKAKSNLYNLLEEGNDALAGLIDVAKLSQHPRAYEVVSTLIKTLSEVNKDLLDLTKTKNAITGEGVANQQKVTNNLFVGSTAELQKLLQKKPSANGNEPTGNSV